MLGFVDRTEAIICSFQTNQPLSEEVTFISVAHKQLPTQKVQAPSDRFLTTVETPHSTTSAWLTRDTHIDWLTFACDQDPSIEGRYQAMVFASAKIATSYTDIRQ